jgi:Ca2+-binding EF-hand superfamily protein
VRSYKSLEEEEEAILSAFRVFDKENTGISTTSILVY